MKHSYNSCTTQFTQKPKCWKNSVGKTPMHDRLSCARIYDTVLSVRSVYKLKKKPWLHPKGGGDTMRNRI